MKISCQSCQSKYNVADEKVQGKIVKIRCRKCGATIVVNGTAGGGTNGSVAPQPPQQGAADGGEQWHVNVSENDQRSMSMAELVEAYNAGEVTQETFIWTDGMDDWKPLSEVEAVVSALHAHAEQASGGQAETYAASVVPAYEPEAQPASAPTARTYEAPAPPPSYGSSYTAQAAAAPASEPRRAAVVKREARSGKDLFGSAGGDDVQTSAPSMPHVSSREADDAASKLTGERNENSVLFSLAVLTKGSDERPVPEAPSSAAKKDDSGLIDLKALAARTESMRPVAPKPDGDVFAPPLGFTPPPLGSPIGALGAVGGGDAQAKSKLPLFIGLGAGAVLLVIVSVVVTAKIFASNAPAPSAAALAMPAVPTAAEPAPSATAEATASAAPSASVASAPKPKAAGGGYHPAAGGAKPGAPAAAGGAGAAAAAAPAAPAAPAAAPKKNDCGCNGDLMCLMKCSTH